MATKNKPVTSYLPQDLEDVLTEYCNNKGLVRDYNNGEQKPQLGTAIVEILESYFFGDKQEDNSPPQQSSELAELKDMMQALASRVDALESNVSSTAPSNVYDNSTPLLSSTAPSNVNGNGLEKQPANKHDVTSQEAEDNELKDGTETSPPAKIYSVADLQQLYPDGLKQQDLAQRFRCASSTISYYKKKSHQQWDNFCTTHDPLSLYWRMKGKRFKPSNAPNDPNWKLTEAHLS